MTTAEHLVNKRRALSLPGDTERLRFRRFDEGDFDTVFSWTQAEDFTRFVGRVLDADGTTALLQRWIASMEEPVPLGRRAVCRIEDDALIGYCGLWPLPNTPERGIELSYGLGKAWWGHGYGLEAARAMLAYGFTEGFTEGVTGGDAMVLDEILAAIHPDNAGSLAVAQKLGMNYVEDIDWSGYGQVRLYAKKRGE